MPVQTPALPLLFQPRGARFRIVRLKTGLDRASTIGKLGYWKWEVYRQALFAASWFRTLDWSPRSATTITASMFVNKFVNKNKTTHPWPVQYSQGQSGSASTFQRTFQRAFQVSEADQDSPPLGSTNQRLLSIQLSNQRFFALELWIENY